MGAAVMGGDHEYPCPASSRGYRHLFNKSCRGRGRGAAPGRHDLRSGPWIRVEAEPPREEGPAVVEAPGPAGCATHHTGALGCQASGFESPRQRVSASRGLTWVVVTSHAGSLGFVGAAVGSPGSAVVGSVPDQGSGQ